MQRFPRWLCNLICFLCILPLGLSYCIPLYVIDFRLEWYIKLLLHIIAVMGIALASVKDAEDPKAKQIFSGVSSFYLLAAVYIIVNIILSAKSLYSGGFEMWPFLKLLGNGIVFVFVIRGYFDML